MHGPMVQFEILASADCGVYEVDGGSFRYCMQLDFVGQWRSEGNEGGPRLPGRASCATNSTVWAGN